MTDSAFTKEQFDAIYPAGIERHYWNHARNHIIGTLLAQYGLNKGSILEIGCGKGIVVDFLRVRGIDCAGVEQGDAEVLPGCRDHVFTNTDAFELPAATRQGVETILLLDVLEHMPDPDAFIGDIREKFENARHLLVTVPARQELWSNYDVYNGHFRRYSLSDALHLSVSQIAVRDARYFFHLLYPVFWILTRMVRKRNTVIKAPAGVFILLHRAISWVLRMDFHIMPHHWRGTSIIAVFSFRR